MKDALMIIVPAVITVFGYLLTCNNLKKEFHRSLERAIIEDKKRVYINALTNLTRQITTVHIKDEQPTTRELNDNLNEMRLIGSKRVADLYQKQLSEVLDISIKLRTSSMDEVKEVDHFEELNRELVDAMRKDIGIEE